MLDGENTKPQGLQETVRLGEGSWARRTSGTVTCRPRGSTACVGSRCRRWAGRAAETTSRAAGLRGERRGLEGVRAGTALQPGTSRRGRRGRGPRWLAHRARTALGAEVTFEQNVQSNRVHRCEGVGVQRRRAPHGWARSRVLPWCNQPGGSRLLSGGRRFHVPRGLSASFFKRVASVGPVRRLVTGSEGLPRQQS